MSYVCHVHAGETSSTGIQHSHAEHSSQIITRGLNWSEPDILNMESSLCSQVPKANLNKHLKRQVAQLATVIRERQLAEGITRKEALQIETAAALSSGIAFK